MDIFKQKLWRHAHDMNPNKAAKRLATKSARAAVKQMTREEMEIAKATIKEKEQEIYDSFELDL